MYQVDTIALLRQVFGYAKVKAFQPLFLAKAPVMENPYDVATSDVLDSEVKSYLGTPILMPVKIMVGRYRERKPDGSIVFIDYPEYTMPFSSIFEVTMPKVIIKTRIAGRNGTRTEYINDDDYQIRFKGLIVNNENDLPPAEGIRNFRRMLDVKGPMRMQCEFLEWLGVGDVLVDGEPSIFQIEGYAHVVGFTVDFISNNIVEARSLDSL